MNYDALFRLRISITDKAYRPRVYLRSVSNYEILRKFPMSAVADKLSGSQWPKRHLIDVDQYYKMAQAGVLTPDARVELIEGEVIDMAPIGSKHSHMVDRLAKKLILAVGDHAMVGIQRPIRLSNRSEPQPDLLLRRIGR